MNLSASARWDLTGRAIREPERLRSRYGTGPLRVSLFGHPLAVVLDPGDVTRVLAPEPEPFSGSGQPVTDRETLERVRELVIPPAWPAGPMWTLGSAGPTVTVAPSSRRCTGCPDRNRTANAPGRHSSEPGSGCCATGATSAPRPRHAA